MSATPGLPVPVTPEGRAGLDAVLADPGRALVALDFDGTLSPIVADPAAARAHPGAVPALRQVAAVVGTVAVITGRPAASAVELGGFRDVPGLTVLGHYGLERWADGALESPPPPPGVEAARAELPALLAGAGAPDGTRIEDKGHAVAVHTRRAADPQAALDRLRGAAGGPGRSAWAGGRAGTDGHRAAAAGHGQGPGPAHPRSATAAVRGHVLRGRPG